jgi:HD-like signal output (HDOD) protein
MSTSTNAAAPRTTIEELVDDSQALISLPEVYLRLRQVMDAPDSSMDDVAKVIALDPALTARLLRIANSALYNFPSQIETLSRAVNILGLRQVHDLVLATSVAQAFAGLPNDLMDMKTFWYRSIYRGFLARELGKALGVRDTEGLFIRGLLLDLGHLVLYQRFPEACRTALAEGGDDLTALLERETALIGCDAISLGAELMRRWQLPAGMIATFDHLMQPAAAGDQAVTVAIVQLAAQLAQGLDTDLLLDQIIRQVPSATWMLLDLEPEQVHELVENASEDVLDAMYQVFTSTA